MRLEEEYLFRGIISLHSLRGERRTLGDAEESGSGGSISYRPIGLRLTIHVSMASPHSPFKSRAADYRRDEMIFASTADSSAHLVQKFAACYDLALREPPRRISSVCFLLDQEVEVPLALPVQAF